jgi:hypothetical protein
MKTKFYFRGDTKDLEYPALVDAIVEVFDTVKTTKFATYFDKSKVYIYPQTISGTDPRNFAFLKMVPDDNPEFYFGINAMYAEYKMQSWLFSHITKSPIFNEYHAMRATVGHEIGHWIFFKSLAKLPYYGGSAQVAYLMNVKCYGEVGGNTDYQRQKAYRNIYPERWADRLSRIILTKMPDMGRSDSVAVRSVHIHGLAN